jgi:hypothetical protein
VKEFFLTSVLANCTGGPEEVKKPGTQPKVNYNQTQEKRKGKSEDLSR